jgi:hypothetical protein
MVRPLTRETGRLVRVAAPRSWRWRGRTVKLVDGTGISMPDTLENQASYPQPHSQAPGVGFPLMRLVAVVCLATGALIDAAIGPHEGKGSSELGLPRGLGKAFSAGDLVLADAFYCYFVIATLLAAGVDVLFEQHGARFTDFRRGTALGPRHHVVVGNRPGRIEPRARKRWPKPYPWLKIPRAEAREHVRAYGHLNGLSKCHSV